MQHSRRRTRALVAMALIGILGLSACGTKENHPALSGIPVTTTTTAAP